MVIGTIFLEWTSFYQGSIGTMLSKWQEWGVFQYALPFLLIFALVSVILSNLKIFGKNKAVSSIIALVVALMALQFDFVPKFFSEIFPRMGVALAILLVVLILLGLFVDPDQAWLNIALLIIGAVAVIVTLITTANSVGWNAGYMWSEHLDAIITVVIFVALALWLMFSGRPPRTSQMQYLPLLHRTPP